ncbi:MULTISPECIES: serine hydrolase [unclassified Streptomyces]|uniref:serine hydrolase n=1 Tax=unclassified Streptomyces TaxID=2593676 RepID=UPI0033B49BE0
MTAPPHPKDAAPADRIAALFQDAGADGYVHVCDVDSGAEVSYRADAPVILASVRKIAIALEYARQAAAGTLDRAGRHTVTVTGKEGGGIGTDGCLDDVVLAARDLVHFMMSMSDNAATDKLLSLLGADNVRTTLAGLGCTGFPVGTGRELYGGEWNELGIDPDGDIDAQLEHVTDDRIRALSVLDPQRAQASTPREVTGLLTKIWKDQAGSAEACAEVRELMGRQLSTHRLVAAFEDGIKVAAKNGFMWNLRNEAGVVEYPDGRRYAVAVFARTHSLATRQPKADAVIGSAARAAIDFLRR